MRNKKITLRVNFTGMKMNHPKKDQRDRINPISLSILFVLTLRVLYHFTFWASWSAWVSQWASVCSSLAVELCWSALPLALRSSWFGSKGN